MMNKPALIRGEGRTRVSLSSYNTGNDIIVCIYNENAHIGAVALGEYDPKENRTSCSVITRLGHKDDAVANKSAYTISKHIKRPVCVIAGIHLDDITKREIEQIIENTDSLVEEFIAHSER
jgi:hypothetical protein